MSEQDEDFDWSEYRDAMEKQSRLRKESNRENARAMLTQRGIPFESHNDGVHWVLSAGQFSIDYWPTTGKYIVREPRLGSAQNTIRNISRQGRGITGVISTYRQLKDIARRV